MKKRVKAVKRIVSVILVLSMFTQPALSDYVNITSGGSASAAETQQSATGETQGDYSYVSDIRIYTGNGKTKEQVVELAKNEGYTIFEEKDVPVDLKDKTLQDPIYIGYKTTGDEEDAIRSIKSLEMKRGYEWFDYQKVAEGQMEKMEIVASDMEVAISEFKENLNKGSEAAIFAKDYLNYMYFLKKKGTPLSGNGIAKTLEDLSVEKNSDLDNYEKIRMGDFLSSDSVDTQTVKTFILQMNGGSLSALYSQLGLGVADVGETWADRIGKAETYTTKEVTSSQLSCWDILYYEYALELLPVLKDFAVKYRKAEVRKNNNGGEVQLVDVDSDAHSATAENTDEIVKASENDASNDIIYEIAYGMLNMYNLDDEKKAGDYLLEIAEATYTKRADYRRLYPLIEALTDGQYGMMKYLGVAQMATYLNQSDEFFDELEDKKEEVLESMEQATGSRDGLYIFEGINTEFYTRKVALTSAAYRESNASNTYIDITKQGTFYEDINMAFMVIGLVASVSAVITGGITIGLLIVGSQLSIWAACLSIVGTGVFMTIAGIIGCTAFIVGWFALAAMAIAAIVYFVKWLIDQITDDDAEDYTTMPREVYDVDELKINGEKKTSYIKYDVVTDSSGNPQDLNNKDGKRWVLMYYSKNKYLGSPVCVDKKGNVFTLTVDKVDTPDGYEPVTVFGEKNAHNLNSYSRLDAVRSVYLHYRTKDQIDGTIYEEDDVEKITDKEVITEVDENQGTPVAMTKKEKYLYGITISSEKTMSAAKAGITMLQGYKLYDKNLTPGNGYTYMGYASTTVKNDAITDIRIVPNFAGDSAALGGAGYSTAGRLPDGSTLVYTRYSCAGSPIIDTFKMTSKLEPITSIYEPVNLLCGGEAYNFTGKRASPLYLYFKPSIAYTSGEQYISGLRFVSGRKGEATRTRTALGNDLGMTAFDCNFAPYSLYGTSDKYYYRKSVRSGHGSSHITTSRTLNYGNYQLYLYYSLTYNPYRAIYDVKCYTATTKAKALQLSISTTNGSYAAVENTCISDNAFYDGSFSESSPTKSKPTNNESIRTLATRTYIDVSLGSNNYGRSGTTTYKLEDNITWSSSKYRSQGLYVLGHTDDASKKPLRKGDIIVTTDKTKRAGMRSVQRFTDPYNEEPINLAYQDPSKSSAGVYVFLKGEAKKKGRYISGICVKTYKRPKDTEKHKYSDDELKEYDKMSDDICRMSLLSEIDGEVLNYNVAVKQDNAWYRKADVTGGTASYIGVTRTDDENYAITGLLMYKATELPPIKVSVKGIEYHRVGDKFGDYYLYYSKSPGANPGVPVEKITFDDIPVIKGQATAVGITGSVKEPKAEYMDSFGGQNGYIHMQADTGSSVVNELKILEGEMDEVLPKFMSEGFNYMITENLNANTNGSKIYLAYKTCSADLLDIEEDDLEETNWDMDSDDWDNYDDDWDFDDEDWSDFDINFDIIIFDECVIRDIVCRVGKNPDEKFTLNGADYYLASDVSLNRSLDGSPSIYMYYTLDEKINVGKNAYSLPAIESIAMCSGNAVPSREGDTSRFGQWEMMLNDEGREVNMNEGVISKNGNHVRDCRLFMFLKRHKGGVKPGAEIIRGVVSETKKSFEIFIKK